VKDKILQLRVKLFLGLITLVVGLLASNLALFQWVEKIGLNYLLGYYARYICAYGGFTAMIFGAMLVNDFLALRSVTKNSHEIGVKEKKEKKKAVHRGPKKRRETIAAASLAVFLFMLSPIAVSSLVSYTATVVITPSSTSGSIWLYVNGDDGARTGWKRIGTNPYLDAIDYDTNYLSVKATNKEAGNFDFTDSGKSTETIDNVTVQLYVKQSRAGDSLEVFVWNGSAWTSLGLKEIPTSWNWVNWTASAQLNSWAKIDGAKIYFVSYRQPGTNEFLVDCARLQVDYS
jgi:hypothetical protein